MLCRQNLKLVVRAWVLTTLAVAGVQAQNIVVSSPNHSISNGSYESFGIGINYDDGNFQFSYQPNANPPDGGYDPNSEARLNVDAGPLSFSLFGSQGSRRSIVSQTPSVTIPNGGTGYFIDTQIRPFVTGYVPVVGGQPVLQGPSIQERWNATRSMPATKREPAAPRVSPSAKSVSSAQSGDISVAEIKRRLKASSKSDEVSLLLQQARAAAAEEKWRLAKNHLRNALRKATGADRSAIDVELERIEARIRR